jgi:ankyrin repeat protein
MNYYRGLPYERIQLVYNAIRSDDVDALRIAYTVQVADDFNRDLSNRSKPLCFCVSQNARKCAEWLIATDGGDVDINQMCADHTSLCYAVNDNHLGFVKILLDAGASVDFIGYSSLWTAFQLAWRNVDKDMALVLIDHGAKLNVDIPQNRRDADFNNTVRSYYEARLQRRDRQRAFLAGVLSLSKMNKDLVRLFPILKK